MPVKRFFLFYRQINRLQAEESLLLLRVISQPHLDPDKMRGDSFVEDLQKAAGIEPSRDSANDLMTAAQARDWGIAIKKKGGD